MQGFKILINNVTKRSKEDEYVENARKLFLENDPEEIEEMKMLKSENQFETEVYKIHSRYDKMLENVMHVRFFRIRYLNMY